MCAPKSPFCHHTPVVTVGRCSGLVPVNGFSGYAWSFSEFLFHSPSQAFPGDNRATLGPGPPTAWPSHPLTLSRATRVIFR
jgi:hypothetical protein